MRIFRTSLMLALMAFLSVTLYSCKTKKVVAKPKPAPVATQPPVKETVTEAAPVKEETAPVEEKANFSFANIQFEFNSSVLKTESFQVLDQATREMKKDPSVKFVLNGHSSAEGSPAHNMQLSVDRANAVKSYLINAGLSASNFTVKGHGEAQPVSSNTSEEGRVQNRRVEIKKN
jgi:outer membrane protein OmpA-like peptidoglycan-associated protein